MTTDTTPLDVVAIGAAIVDILGQVDDGLLQKHDLPKGSMVLVDRDKAEAIYADMPGARAVCGGSAANTIAGLAALGAKVGFVGKVKDDALGAIFRDDILTVGAEYGVAPFPADHDGATARSMILVTPDAERTMCTDLGVSGLLQIADLPMPAIERASVLYLEGYLWDQEPTKDAFRHAMAAAKAAGGQVALTLSDSFCVDRHRASFREIVAGPVDILFANEDEILSLYEATDFEAAVAAAARDVGLAAITRSEKGCVVLKGAERVDVSAEAIEALVDTTGAGDQFAAGFLYGHTRGMTLEMCGRMGCISAAEVIQHIGARPEKDMRALYAEKRLF